MSEISKDQITLLETIKTFQSKNKSEQDINICLLKDLHQTVHPTDKAGNESLERELVTLEDNGYIHHGYRTTIGHFYRITNKQEIEIWNGKVSKMTDLGQLQAEQDACMAAFEIAQIKVGDAELISDFAGQKLSRVSTFIHQKR